MCRGTSDGCYVFRTTVPAVLADSLLHCFYLRVGCDHEHIQEYVSESVQSCEATKQLLQGEKQQQFYVRGNLMAFCVFLLSNPYCFLHIPWKLFYLTLSSPLIIP